MKNRIRIVGDTLIIEKIKPLRASETGKGPNEFRIVNVNPKAGRAQLLVSGFTVHVKREGKGPDAVWSDKHGNVYEGL